MDDAHPIHPDWVVTRPILSGVCGSDTKLVLGDFDDGDIDNPMAAFSSLPHVPGHEVVAEVVALGPDGPGRRGRPAGGAQPLAELCPARDPAAVPAVPGRRPQPVLVVHQGRHQPGRPHRRGHRSARGVGRAAGRPLVDALPGARRTSPTRPPCWPTPSRCRSTPSSAIPRPPAAGPWSSEPVRSGLASVAILTALYPRGRGGGGGPVPGPGGHGPHSSAPSAVFAHEPRLALVESPGRLVGRRAPPGLRRSAHGPPRPHRRGLRLGGQARDVRGRGAGPGRAGPAGLHRRGRARPVGVDPGLLQGADHRRVQRLRHGGVRGGPRATPSTTTSAWSRRAGST